MIITAPLRKLSNLFIIRKIDGKSISFCIDYFRNAIKMSKKTDFKPDQPPFDERRRELDVLLPPSETEIQIDGFFSIVLGEPKQGIYNVILLYRDSTTNTFIEFYEFEMIYLLKNNVKVDVDGSIIKFSFETCPIDDGEPQTFSYTFFFSDSSESKFELGNPLKSMPILLPLNGFLHLCFNIFYYIIPRPKIDQQHHDYYEIYIVQSSSDEMCEKGFRQGDRIIQKIVWNSGIPSIRRDSTTGHFFVASESDDPNKPISIAELRKLNHLINLPDPVELNEDGTLVLSDLSIPFDQDSILITMNHIYRDMYLFQTSIHPTIQEICIVRSSPPDDWRPKRGSKYFSDGDVIVKKIYLRTPNPLDILKICETSFMLGTNGSDDFAGYLLKL